MYVFLFLLSMPLQAQSVTDIRSKLSAGDLISADAVATDLCAAKPNTTECAAAQSWLARGAFMLGDHKATASYIAETKRLLGVATTEDANRTAARGAVIETEARLLAAKGKKNEALRLLQDELRKATDYGLQARIQKTINALTLTGKRAPRYDASLQGKPTLLFLWAHWCGDCRAQIKALGEFHKKHGDRVRIVAPTRRYQRVPGIDKPTDQQENEHIVKVWRESYAPLAGIDHPIDNDTMLAYGVSSTPTFAYIDAKGIVRYYGSSRMSLAQLEKLLEKK
ncbi:MAG: TlpA family protein disulfide reductase [Bryobacterales bacterium]|nr:TlpA family protein disulfide reductase [Bryobacterales bacterium]